MQGDPVVEDELRTCKRGHVAQKRKPCRVCQKMFGDKSEMLAIAKAYLDARA